MAPTLPLWALSLSSQPGSVGLPIFSKRYYHPSITQARNLGFILSSPTSYQSPNPVYSAFKSSLHATLCIPTASILTHVPITSDHSFGVITASCLHMTAWVSFPKQRCDLRIPLLRALGMLPSALGVISNSSATPEALVTKPLITSFTLPPLVPMNSICLLPPPVSQLSLYIVPWSGFLSIHFVFVCFFLFIYLFVFLFFFFFPFFNWDPGGNSAF